MFLIIPIFIVGYAFLLLSFKVVVKLVEFNMGRNKRLKEQDKLYPPKFNNWADDWSAK